MTQDLKSLINPDDDYLDNDLMINEGPAVRPHPLISGGELIDNLSPTQEKFLVAKLYGMNDKGAAEASGVVAGTAYNWKKDPDFKKLYDLVINNPVELSAEVVAFGLAKALNKLVDMLDHPSIAVQQYAIDKLAQISGIHKQRVEVTRKNDISDGDLDAAISRLEKRRVDNAGEGAGDSEV